MTCRMFRTALAVVVLVSVMNLPALLRSPAQAADVVRAATLPLTFDELPVAFQGINPMPLQPSYSEKLGVTFNDPMVEAYDVWNSATPDFAHSGTLAMHQCESSEQSQCDKPLIMTFAAPQRYVGVWIGYSDNLDQDQEVTMTAFDAVSGGKPVHVTTTVLEASDTGSVRAQYVQVAGENAEIRRVAVGFSKRHGLTPDLVYDDVDFGTDDPGAHIPTSAQCEPGAAEPALRFNQPKNLVVVHENLFSLAGQVETTQDLTDAIIAAESGGHTRQRPLIPSVTSAAGGHFGPYAVKNLLFPGENTLTLRARNCAGESQVQTWVDYQPSADGTHYAVEALEVTQTIQEPTNSVRLVAGKRTFVRVFLTTAGGADTLSNVSASLSGCLDTSETSDCLADGPDFSPLQPRNPIAVDSLSGRDNLVAKRGKMKSGLLFELPLDWRKSGSLHLWIDSSTLSPKLGCDGCDKAGQTTVRFEEAPSITVDFVDVSYESGGATQTPAEPHRKRLKSWLQRAYPTNDVQVDSDIDTVVISDPPTCDIVNQALLAAWVKMTYGGNAPVDVSYSLTPTRYYGLVADQGKEDSVPMQGCALPATKKTEDQQLDYEHFASGPAGADTAWTWDLDGSYADWYGGHEIAHTFNRKHVAHCGQSKDEEGTNYPDPDGLIRATIDQKRIDYVGFDSGNAALGISERVYRADKWHDVMTYCSYVWISAFSYDALWAQMDAEEKALPVVEAGEVPTVEFANEVDGESADDVGAGATPDLSQEVVLVLGTINMDKSTVTLRPSTVLPRGVVTQRDANGDYRVELRTVNEAVLATYAFAPLPYSDQLVGADELAQLSEIVPWVDGTAFIDIYKGNSPRLARQRVSTRAPHVQITSPNGGEVLQGGVTTVAWTGSDENGDDLTYDLLYSADGGVTWRSLVSGLHEQESDEQAFDVDLSRIPGSNQALFRVIASDGVLTASDQSDATFHVASHAPEVSIISPGNGTQYGTSETIVLVGEATDIDQGTLDDDALVWTADGEETPGRILGRGASIAVSDLSPGRHTITLTATGADDLTAATSITIRVANDEPAVLDWAAPGEPRPEGLGADGLFLYDNANEEGTFFAGDGEGSLTPLRTFDVLLNGWSSVVPGNFGGDGSTDLLFYASDLGVGEFFAADGSGGMGLLSGNEGFTKGWDLIVPGNFGGEGDWTDLLFYDRLEGVGKIYTTDGTGKIQLLGTPVPLGHTWTSIVVLAGQIGGDERGDLLLYDKETGQTQRYAIKDGGVLEPLGETAGWDAGWDTIVPGHFGGEEGRTDLLLFDADSGKATILTADGTGELTLPGRAAPFPGHWNTVVGGAFGVNSPYTDLFFYDAEQGLGSFYAMNEQGEFQELASVDDLAQGWDQVVPGHFGNPWR